MFGSLKENVLSKLEKTYNDKGEKVFKKEFNQYIKTIKENKNLKEFYEVYDLFNQVNFDNELVAKEFIDESINYLKQFDKNDVKMLEAILESGQVMPLHRESIEFKLDNLVFNENLSLKDKAIYKVELMKQITNRNTTNINPQEAFSRLHEKINENVSKLDPNQIELLDLFVENDNQKIDTFYSNLINEVETAVEDNILKADNGEIVMKLVEVKRKLNGLKNQKPTITEVEKIISLKESFTN